MLSPHSNLWCKSCRLFSPTVGTGTHASARLNVEWLISLEHEGHKSSFRFCANVSVEVYCEAEIPQHLICGLDGKKLMFRVRALHNWSVCVESAVVNLALSPQDGYNNLCFWWSAEASGMNCTVSTNVSGMVSGNISLLWRLISSCRADLSTQTGLCILWKYVIVLVWDGP